MVLLNRNEVAETVLFARRTCRHAHAEKERLLDDENQHSRDEERGKTVLRVVDRHFLVLNGVLGERVLFGGCSACALHLDIGVHGQAYVGVGRQYALVVEHTAHVGVCTYVHLFTLIDALRKVARNVNRSIGIAVLDEPLCLVHIGAVRHDVHVGRGVKMAHILAALRRAAVVYHGYGYVAHHLVVIDERIKQRIADGYEEEEDYHPLVAHDGAELFSKYMVQVGKCLTDVQHSVDIFLSSLQRASFASAPRVRQGS